MFLFLILLIPLSACGNTYMMNDNTTAKSGRLAKPINHAAVFVPSEDKSSWTSVYMDLPIGTYIFTGNPFEKPKTETK